MAAPMTCMSFCLKPYNLVLVVPHAPKIEYKSLFLLSRLCTTAEGFSAAQTRPKVSDSKLSKLKLRLSSAPTPTLSSFLENVQESKQQLGYACENELESVPYLPTNLGYGNDRKVFFDVYGCQMNVNDTEIAWSILKQSSFQKTMDVTEADVILVMTCSIREGAEQKIWNRLEYLKALKRRRAKTKRKHPIKIGILGCMAERLKTQILEREQLVDLVAGPDAYRDLPRMLASVHAGQTAVNVLLSQDETYADIAPVQLTDSATAAFVSIMRGCDNMCSYCIVPFTRGRERSRPIQSILNEVKQLSDQGIREVTLLGQNVNSYRDLSRGKQYTVSAPNTAPSTGMSRGFQTVYKPKVGGIRFAELLDEVSRIDKEMRIRFTSPHPKDFPDEVLSVVKDTANICKQLHLPAQSGNTGVLESMRRGYTREAYIDLIHHVREILPDISLSSDFIFGFCGETESAHKDSLSLLSLVKYNFCYMFPYSMRQKTRAQRRLTDDVAHATKLRRLQEGVATFRAHTLNINLARIGCRQLVLIEGESKRTSLELAGRNDGNTKVIIPDIDVSTGNPGEKRRMSPGDYVAVQVTSATSQVLKATPLQITTLSEYNQCNEP